MFSKKVTKIDKIFNVDLTVTTCCQIDGEYFVNFCGLLRKRELYRTWKVEVIKNKKGAGQDFLEMDLCVQAHAAAALLFVEGRLSKQLVITTNQAKLLYYLESTLVQ